MLDETSALAMRSVALWPDLEGSHGLTVGREKEVLFGSSFECKSRGSWFCSSVGMVYWGHSISQSLLSTSKHRFPFFGCFGGKYMAIPGLPGG